MYSIQFGKCSKNLNAITRYLRNLRLVSSGPINNEYDEFTDVPNYPPIHEIGEKFKRQLEIESWYKKIERQKTIEEKLFEINVPRYWGWKCLMLNEGEIPYNSLNFVKYLTRTYVLPSNEFQKLESETNVKKGLIGDIKPVLEEELSYQLSILRNQNYDSELEKEQEISSIVVNTIHRVIMRDLNQSFNHLKECIVDYKPRLEAFWSVGGIEPPESVKKRRKDADKKISKEDLMEPVNRWVQYLGKPLLHMRHQKLLQPIWGSEINGEVPVWTFDPEVIGIQSDYRHGTSIPGFWPGDKAEFSVLSYNLTNHLSHRPPSYGLEDAKEAELAQAILASFSWLVSLAAYQGFSPFSEITYPMVTQTVLTNGKEFSFMTYQMNTNLLHSEFAQKNSKTNVCWWSPSQPLFDSFEKGKIIGLNESVLDNLLSFYTNIPVERKDVELKPYLGTDIQRIAQYEDEEKRCWLEREFKHFSANRPRHRTDLKYELYEWERIYKVEHETRPRDARRRPFELNEHPYKRKMSDHPGEYIPRSLRPDKELPKWRQQKFKKTYYPQ